MSCPVIWVFTLTVLRGVTVPKALRTTGISPLAAEATPTGMSAPASNRPASLVGAARRWAMYHPAPTTTARPRLIPVRSRFIAYLAPKPRPSLSGVRNRSQSPPSLGQAQGWGLSRATLVGRRVPNSFEVWLLPLARLCEPHGRGVIMMWQLLRTHS